MNISGLINLIAQLKREIEELTDKKNGLERVRPAAAQVQPRIHSAISAAQSRVGNLAALGLSSILLEDILAPVRNAPDCCGMSGEISQGVTKLEDDIFEKNRKKSDAEAEKRRQEIAAAAAAKAAAEAAAGGGGSAGGR